MKLNYQGIREAEKWAAQNIALPEYDPEAVAARTKESPVWVHFGIGNIFRAFPGAIADRLLNEGKTDRGIICVETFDGDIVDQIYRPHDDLALTVILDKDGGQEMRVIGSLSESLRHDDERKQTGRLSEIFSAPTLQMVSFTITEKGYALRDAEGRLTDAAKRDLAGGPEEAAGVIGVVTAMLYERYRTCGAPIALVSMDNVSQNGKKLREAVLELAEGWAERGFVDAGFPDYLNDEKQVTFPWSMIDKITPRPRDDIADRLSAAGVEDMGICVTGRHTYIAPFVNAERPEYLVVEDAFPNGRPPLEDAGVYMTDRETVNRAERMKVTACLNPIHTALCSFACMLGYELFADGMRDADLFRLAEQVGYRESLPVVKNPGILDPKRFLDEVIKERFPNAFLGDTSARIAVDISQMVGIRFGETIKAYVEREGSAERLLGIPLAIAGWIRYLIGVDDEGNPMDRSPDPMLDELSEQLRSVRFGRPESLEKQLIPILSNRNLFGSDLYEVGIGTRIEEMLREMLAAPGAVRQTLHRCLAGITTIGEILVDMTQTSRDANGIVHFAANPGGAPANVAVAASKLGIPSTFIGCVGTDSYGDLLEKTLIKYGVSTAALQTTDKASTTLAVVTVDETGERAFSFCRKPGADTCIDAGSAVEAARRAHVLHFGSVSLTDPVCRETVMRSIRAAKEAGALITYDPNYRAALWDREEEAVEQMRAVLPLCDIVKISEEETLLLAGHADPRTAAEALIRQGIRLVIVTLGAQGAMWMRGEDSGLVPGYAVNVADTNGAGDTFFGSFLSRIIAAGGLDRMTEKDLNDAVRFSNRAASITTSRPGAIPAMPTLDEMQDE